MAFHLDQLLLDVFAPAATERVLVMVDVPRPGMDDTPDWRERRRMAAAWREAFLRLGCDAAPLLSYPATTGNNADLGATGEADGQTVSIRDAIARAHIVVAMTTHSATAPLSAFVKERSDLRVASMPGVLRRMEQTALAADYAEVARRTHLLAERLTRAESADVIFATGHRFTFDLRYRTGQADDGQCTREKEGFRLINLPSGEAFIVPYEGERPGEPSRTTGTIPVGWQGEIALLQVEQNRILRVEGGAYAARLLAHFEVDPARRNIAELGLGCNDAAVVLGCVLEDEKAGFHWAYGRSEHLGGVTGPESFSDPATVVHHDIVYADGCPIGIREVTLNYPDATRECILRNNRYTLWPIQEK
jgi:leucyl aminopeptidase (aminopeptidase T)